MINWSKYDNNKSKINDHQPCFWSKYFDHIYCIHGEVCEERRYEIENELRRVGILDSGIFTWMIDYDIPKYSDRYENPRSAAGTLGHLRCYCDQLYHHYDRVLILEDDIKFLKDLATIENILSKLPQHDICLFDWFVYTNNIGANNHMLELMEAGKINEFYCYFTSAWLLSCYSITQKVAKYLKEQIINDMNNPRLHAADHHSQNIALKHYRYKESYDTIQDLIDDLFSDWKTILCTKRLAIQDQYDSAINKTIGNNDLYNIELKKPNERDIKIDFNDYNVRKKVNTMQGPIGTENCHV